MREDRKNSFCEKDKSEKAIERKLTVAVKVMGGICPKWVSPGFDGVPDRIILFPMGRIAFVEVKARGKKPRPLQVARHSLLERMGFRVYILDNTSQIPHIVAEVKGGVE